MKIGIAGCGTIGTALIEWLKKHTVHDLVLHDPPLGLAGDFSGVDIGFLSVPVPTLQNRKQDLSILKEVAGQFPVSIPLFVRSTVLPGTCREVAGGRGKIFAMPEFLTARHAVNDFSRLPVVVGDITSDSAHRLLEQALPHKKFIRMGNYEAELSKYAHNAFAAQSVNFWNVISAICDDKRLDYGTVVLGAMSSGLLNQSHSGVPGPDGLKGYGGHCLVGGTRIRGESGLVPIETLRTGDRVLDDSGFTTVTGIAKRWVAETISVTARGRTVRGSLDHIHMVWTPDGLRERLLKEVRIGDEIFIPEQKQSQFRIVDLGPKPNGHVKWWPTNLEITPKIARIIGLYLADGSVSDDKFSTHWTYGEGTTKDFLANETIEILEEMGIHATKRLAVSQGTYGESRCWVVRARSMGLHALFKALGLGRGAKSKRAPLLGGASAEALIGGWLDGDGSYYDGTIMGHSESTAMIADFDAMFLSLGLAPQISRSGKAIKVSMRDDVRRVCAWTRRMPFKADHYVREHAYASPTLRRVEGGWAARVTSVSEDHGAEVFAIETASHKYIANNQLTHNCFPKDVAAFIGYLKENGYQGWATLSSQEHDNLIFRGE